MKNISYIGCLDSKRYTYFKKAADELKIHLHAYSYENIDYEKLANSFIKIDPIVFRNYKINNIHNVVSDYMKKLEKIGQIKNAQFLNHPASIVTLLDKIQCKKILMQNNIPTTPMLFYNLTSFNELFQLMNESKNYRVFIKPNIGSGAAGVMAYQYNHFIDKHALYTSAINSENTLVNTKRIWHIRDKKRIKIIIDMLLSSSNIIEKWVNKDTFEDMNYDLRVVYQFGKIEHIVPRLSNSVITNLHLNNKSTDIKKIDLSKEVLQKISHICQKTSKLYKNINVIGFDFLLTKNKKIFIIELNGQGDCIYKNMYGDNSIYKNQLMYFKDNTNK